MSVIANNLLGFELVMHWWKDEWGAYKQHVCNKWTKDILLEYSFELTQRRVEVVVDVFEESVVFADFGADVDGQRLERVHLSSKLLFKLVVLQDERKLFSRILPQNSPVTLD